MQREAQETEQYLPRSLTWKLAEEFGLRELQHRCVLKLLLPLGVPVVGFEMLALIEEEEVMVVGEQATHACDCCLMLCPRDVVLSSSRGRRDTMSVTPSPTVTDVSDDASCEDMDVLPGASQEEGAPLTIQRVLLERRGRMARREEERM
eukprot:1101517-Rhodomonas_salina.1